MERATVGGTPFVTSASWTFSLTMCVGTHICVTPLNSFMPTICILVSTSASRVPKLYCILCFAYSINRCSEVGEGHKNFRAPLASLLPTRAMCSAPLKAKFCVAQRVWAHLACLKALEPTNTNTKLACPQLGHAAGNTWNCQSGFIPILASTLPPLGLYCCKKTSPVEGGMSKRKGPWGFEVDLLPPSRAIWHPQLFVPFFSS